MKTIFGPGIESALEGLAVKKHYRSPQPRRETSAGSFQCEAPALNFFGQSLQVRCSSSS
jgi:hypothetical protein